MGFLSTGLAMSLPLLHFFVQREGPRWLEVEGQPRGEHWGQSVLPRKDLFWRLLRWNREACNQDRRRQVGPSFRGCKIGQGSLRLFGGFLVGNRDFRMGLEFIGDLWVLRRYHHWCQDFNKDLAVKGMPMSTQEDPICSDHLLFWTQVCFLPVAFLLEGSSFHISSYQVHLRLYLPSLQVIQQGQGPCLFHKAIV